MTFQAGSGNTDYRRFYYGYDLAGRLKKVSTDGSVPLPDYLYTAVEYGYNENSQTDTLKYQDGAYQSLSWFNQRNWVAAVESRENKMSYNLDYYLNGNVKSRKVLGNYRMNYSGEQREMNSAYTYDKANRLTNVSRFNVKSYSPVEAFSYDKDGNLLTLTRDYSGDNFSYQYYSGTNRLMNITGTAIPQYIYDYNGNVIADSVRKITDIKYDYRNLPVEMNMTPPQGDRYKYKMVYKYDESGNRTRKMKYRSRLGEETWTLMNDEVYIRDASGKETAMYENGNLQYINIWGAGLEGKVKKDEKGDNIFSYYYKDHLGSITAVMDGGSGTITQAQDYDAWGDICRSYSTTDTTVNKFTGKERDQETGYDYFGARYYDSKIGRWLQIEPLYDKYIQYSPYQYGLLNPMKLVDADGNIIIMPDEKKNDFIQKLFAYMNDNTSGFSSNHIKILNYFNSADRNHIVSFDNGKFSPITEDEAAATTIAYNPTFNGQSLGVSKSVDIILNSDFFQYDIEIAAILMEHELHHAEFYKNLTEKLVSIERFNSWFENPENLKAMYYEEISAYKESLTKLDEWYNKGKRTEDKIKTYNEVKGKFINAIKDYEDKIKDLNNN